MSTPAEEFEARIVDFPEHVTRAQIAAMTGRSVPTVVNWCGLPTFPRPIAATRAGEAKSYDRDDVVAWCREHVHGAHAERVRGPEPTRTHTGLPHTPGERLTITEIGRRRGYRGSKPSAAVSHLARTYGAHPEHPFPPADDTGRRDAGDVDAWYEWYDAERPGQTTRLGDRARPGREARAEEVIRAAAGTETDLTAVGLGQEIGLSERVARNYLNQLAPAVLRDFGLVPRSDVPDWVGGDQERAKGLLRRLDAPRPVMHVGKVAYYRRGELDTLVHGQSPTATTDTR